MTNWVAANGLLSSRNGIALSRVDALGICIVLLGLLARAWLLAHYPAVPVSDFKRIVEFAGDLATAGPFADVWHWTLLSAGTSTILSLPLAFSADGVATARTCTMLAMAALPLLPFFMLRGVVPGSARVVATALIALQPAQVIFSNVVAQDNWGQLPVIALACLTIRNMVAPGKGAPIAAAILWGLSFFIRQEMLLATLPLAIMSAWPFQARERWGRAAVKFVAVATLMILMVAGQRYQATGQFRLTSEHGGSTLLGTYIPGAGFGWKPYESFAASIDPAMADDPDRMMAGAGKLALAEIARRPWFHLQRRLGALMQAATGADGTLTYWSLLGEAQPDAKAESAARLAQKTEPWVRLGMVATHALFIGTMFVAFRTRNRILLTLVVAIAIKVATHLIFPSQARFLLVVLSLEALAIGLALASMTANRAQAKGAIVATMIGAAVLSAGVAALPRWEAAIARTDPPVEPNRATLLSKYATARCVLTHGKLQDMSASSFAIVVAHSDPSPGEKAQMRCRIRRNSEAGSLRLEVNDGYAPGGFPDRMRQVVVIDGTVVHDHDVAREAWAGWWPYSLHLPEDGETELVVSVEAVRPDAGPGWGNAALTRVRLVEETAQQVRGGLLAP